MDGFGNPHGEGRFAGTHREYATVPAGLYYSLHLTTNYSCSHFFFLSGSWTGDTTVLNHSVCMFDFWQQAGDFLCANLTTLIPLHEVREHAQLLALFFDEFIITGQGVSLDVLTWNDIFMTFKETLTSQSVGFMEYWLCRTLFNVLNAYKERKEGPTEVVLAI